MLFRISVKSLLQTSKLLAEPRLISVPQRSEGRPARLRGHSSHRRESETRQT